MSLWSSIKKTYKKADSKVGGVLPGGVPKKSKAVTKKTSSYQGPTRPNTNVSTFKSTGKSTPSSSSGGSGGGSSSSTSFVPASYVPPTISKSKVAQYRKEEQALYDKIGYKGGINYSLPTGATHFQIQQTQKQAQIQKAKIIAQAQEEKNLETQQFNNLIKIYEKGLGQKKENLTFIQKINFLGAGTSTRQDIYKIKLLDKKRDKIQIKLNTLNKKMERWASFNSGELTEKHYNTYRKELAPIVAEYNLYRKSKDSILNNNPKIKASATINYDPATGKKVLVLDKVDSSLTAKINRTIEKSLTKIQRSGGGVLTTAGLTGLVVAGTTISFAKGIVHLPATIVKIVKHPSMIKEIPLAIKSSGIATGQLLRTSPTAGLVKIGTEVYLWTKAPGHAIKLTKKLRVQLSRLNPYFKGVKKNSLGIEKIEKVNQVGDIEIILSGGKKIKKGISDTSSKGAFGYSKKELEKYVGKTGPLTTAQVDLLVKSVLKRNPTLKNKKWLYASPWNLKTGKAQVRVSRLGLTTEEATFLDIIRGKAQLFNRNKPQIFILPKEKIFSSTSKLTKSKTIKTTKGFVVPKFSSELEVVLGKGYVLKRGEKLAQTIIKGERVPIIKLIKVKIPKQISMEIGEFNKLTDKINSLSTKIKSIKSPKIKNTANKNLNQLVRNSKNKEIILNKKLKRLTNIDNYFSKTLKPRKIYPLGKKTLSLTSKVSRIKRVSSIPTKSKYPSKGKIKYTSRGQPYTLTKSGSPKFISKSPSKGISKITSKSYPKGSPRISDPRVPPGRYYPKVPAKPIVPSIPIKQFTRKTLKKAIPVYYVVIKRKGKMVKLSPKPFSLSEARDFLSYKLDYGLSRTAYIHPAGSSKKVVGLPKPIKGYFSNTRNKLRPYKIRHGKKKKLYSGYIEKKRFGLDTPGEKREIMLARMKKVRAARMKKRR